MRGEFDCFGIEQVEDIWQRIVALDTGENANTNELGPEYWAVIWEIAIITTQGGLEYIADRIQTIVLPGIRETCEKSKLIRNVEREHQHQQKRERNLAEAYGFNGSGPDLKLDSTFAANGQEDGVPPILLPHGKEAGVYGQNGYDTYERTPPILPVKDGRRAVGMASAPTATTTSGRKKWSQKHRARDTNQLKKTIELV